MYRPVHNRFRRTHGNVRPHVARFIRQYSEEVEIPALNRPVRSPDLNPIDDPFRMANSAMSDTNKKIR